MAAHRKNAQSMLFRRQGLHHGEEINQALFLNKTFTVGSGEINMIP